MTRHRQSSQEHSRWQGKVVLLGYSRALGPPESRRPGEASLGSRLHVQPVRERERPRGRQPARPSEPGLPIVNIYLTSVTPARHRCLLPPPPLVSPRALPSATGRGRAATSLPSGRSALGASARRGRPGAGALRALRAALLLPGGRRAALQINASPSSRVSEGGRSRRGRRL